MGLGYLPPGQGVGQGKSVGQGGEYEEGEEEGEIGEDEDESIGLDFALNDALRVSRVFIRNTFNPGFI